MFGEHYGSLLPSNGALVDLENELQSAYMSTKLNQFGLNWNLSNNSKSVENQRKLQLQKLFKITLSSSKNFPGIVLNFYLFLLSYFRFGSVFNQEIVFRWVPPVGLLYPALGI
jgi:hypothetical protein